MEITRDELAELKAEPKPVCTVTDGKAQIDHAVLLSIRSGLHTWDEPQGLTEKSSQLLADSIATIYGGTRIDKIGVLCAEEKIVFRLNEVVLGPYDALWHETIGLESASGGHLFVAWSSNRREFLFLSVPKSFAVGTFVLADLSRYVAEDTRAVAAELSGWTQSAKLYLLGAGKTEGWIVEPDGGDPAAALLAGFRLAP